MFFGTLSTSFDEESWGNDSYFRSNLYRLEENRVSLGTLESNLDRDYYSFYVTPGYRYEVKLTSDSFWYGWNTNDISNIDGPELSYYCEIHGAAMGNDIEINNIIA